MAGTDEAYKLKYLYEARYSKHGWGCRVVADDEASARKAADAYMVKVNRYTDFKKYPLPTPKVEHVDTIPVAVEEA